MLKNILKNAVFSTQTVPAAIPKEESFCHKTLEERTEESCGRIGPYEELDWGLPMGRERWE